MPEPSNLNQFVISKAATIQLGKALFWDMQIGSDGKTACASCHFQAGADPRSHNQVAPGLLRVNVNKCPNPDTSFQVGGVNYQFKPEDFPFHMFSDPNNRHSAVLRSHNDIASSQGVFSAQFTGVAPGASQDQFHLKGDVVFNKDGLQTRRVEPRNTPTMINSVFNFRDFWDGRATYLFNGVNPSGAMAAAARVYKTNAMGQPEPVQVRIDRASLASLATDPVVSDFEMSAAGRTWPEVGRRMLTARRLAAQDVSGADSVLAIRRNLLGKGLTGDYMAMVKSAFRPEWWNSSTRVTIKGVSYSQAEANFSLFFGLTIQVYGATLVSSDSPFDRFMAGNSSAISNDAKAGMGLFFGKANCASCHGGAEFTNASIRKVLSQPMSRMIMGNGSTAVYDKGHYNITIRKTFEDIAKGGNNPTGRPLSLTALRQQVDATTFQHLIGITPNLTVAPGERIAVNGAFKTPTIRNVDLTAPYFNDGSALTLRQAVEFYNRGGNHFNNNLADADAGTSPLGLTEDEIGKLVAFMKTTTDERVRYAKAPFDHPQLMVPNGHEIDATGRVVMEGGAAKDCILNLPAVGASGRGEPMEFLDYFKGGSYTMRVNHSGMCLELKRLVQPWSDGTIILQNTCDNSVLQQWAQEPAEGGFMLRNALTGKCMDVDGNSTADGARVYEWGCHGGGNQTFNWVDGKLVAKHSASASRSRAA
ncbi:MAG: cytochrome c peroxidase [Aquabacterium sp.]|nr:cytochrome c peroxidase [Aquabacterium sp.]